MSDEELVYPEYYAYFSKLIDIQQKVSEQDFRKSIGKSVRQLIKEGKCLHKVHITKRERVYERKESEDKDAIEEKFNITLENHSRRRFPENSFAVGSNVYILLDPGDAISFKESLAALTGLIVGLSDHSITIEVPTSAYSISSLREDLTVVLGSDHVTYPRQKKMLSLFCSKYYQGNNTIREIIINTFNKKESKTNKDRIDIQDFFFKKLDDSKKEAIRNIMGNNNILLLHGPPGTGKTQTCAEAICQAIYSNPQKKILVCCDSNEAVDNILLKVSDLLRAPSDNIILRVGHPFKVQERTKEYTLLKKFDNHPLIKHFLKNILFIESEYWNKEYKERQNAYRKNCTDFGTNDYSSDELLQEYNNAKTNYSKIQKKIHDLRKIVIEEIFNNSRIFFCTNSVAAMPEIQNQMYDLVVIDEATQATEPSCLIPICRASKLLLAGDHKQLPATVLAPESKEEKELVKTLENSLFEKIFRLNPNVSCPLEIQYRMNDTLLYFPNKKFYGYLKSAEENKDQHLNLYFEEDLVFINDNTHERPNFEEKESYEDRTTSKYNLGEIEIVEKLVVSFRKIGLTDKNIIVITPYNLQKQKIKDQLRHMEITAKSIDGAQGQESDIVILSMVRSNPKKVLGFLKDERRFNVAITRAKSKLIVVGNKETLCGNPLFKEWLEYIQEKGLLIEKEDLYKYLAIADFERMTAVVKQLKIIKPSESYNSDIISKFIKKNESWFTSLNYSLFSKYLDLLFESGWNLREYRQKERITPLIAKLTKDNIIKILETFHWISFRKYYVRGIEDPYFISISEQDRVKIEEYAIKNRLLKEEDLISIKNKVTNAKSHIDKKITMALLTRQSMDEINIEENMVLKDLFD